MDQLAAAQKINSLAEKAQRHRLKAGFDDTSKSRRHNKKADDLYSRAARVEFDYHATTGDWPLGEPVWQEYLN